METCRERRGKTETETDIGTERARDKERDRDGEIRTERGEDRMRHTQWEGQRGRERSAGRLRFDRTPRPVGP